MTAHILLIEPESKLVKFIALELKQAGYQVTELLSELPDLTRLPQKPFSLAILDLNRLKFSGVETQHQVQAIARNLALNLYHDRGFENMAQAQRFAGFNLNLLKALFRMK
jgi:DNA-binding response OmpR family regulator